MDITNEIANSISQQASYSSATLEEGLLTCVGLDYSHVVSIPEPGTFISVHEYLPVLRDCGDLYGSSEVIALCLDPSGKYSIHEGFLAKWTDDDLLFWLGDEDINNVVGWMPFPKEIKTQGNLNSIHQFFLKHHPDIKQQYGITCGNI